MGIVPRGASEAPIHHEPASGFATAARRWWRHVAIARVDSKGRSVVSGEHQAFRVCTFLP